MFAPLVPATLFKGGGFNLAAWEAAQINGFKFDYTKADRNYRNINGASRVSAIDDLIHLSLSDRGWGGQTLEQRLAGQSERLDLAAPWVGFSDAILTDQAPNAVTMACAPGDERVFCTKPIIGLTVGRRYVVDAAIQIIRTKEFARLDLVAGATDVGPALAATNSVTAGTQNVQFSFTATATTMHLRPYVESSPLGDDQARFFNITVREVSDHAATQATVSLAPKWDPTLGAKWDGVDDRQLTGLAASAGNNLLIADALFEASPSALRLLAGARGSDANSRFYLAQDHLTGRLGGGIGAQGTNPINAGPDLRNRRATVAIANNGSQVRLFIYDDQGVATKVYEAAQSGVVNTTVPLAIGGWNDNGTPAFFFGGSTRKVALYHTTEFVDTDLFRNIAVNF